MTSLGNGNEVASSSMNPNTPRYPVLPIAVTMLPVTFAIRPVGAPLAAPVTMSSIESEKSTATVIMKSAAPSNA